MAADDVIDALDVAATKRRSDTKSNKKSKKKKKKSKKKSHHSVNSEEDSSGGGGGGGGAKGADLLPAEEVLLPIRHYVDDRKLMLQHVFASVPRGQIQAMLPPLLKELPMNDVQLLCLHQLERMSDATVTSILSGDVTAPPPISQPTHQGRGGGATRKEGGASAASAAAAAEEDEEEEKDAAILQDCGGKTLMELLELEMRARAIKALLKRQEDEDQQQQQFNNNSQQVAAEVEEAEVEEAEVEEAEVEEAEEDAEIQEVDIELGLSSDSSLQ